MLYEFNSLKVPHEIFNLMHERNVPIKFWACFMMLAYVSRPNDGLFYTASDLLPYFNERDEISLADIQRALNKAIEYLPEYFVTNGDGGYALLYSAPRPIKVVKKQKPISKRIKSYVIERDNSTCWYCGKELHTDICVDHLVPISLGGTDDPDNLVVACRRCNSIKGYKSVDEFLAWRKYNG